MKTLFFGLAAAVDIYSLLIFVRIILTWFSGASYSRPALFLSDITDPYLNWFSRFSFLRLGYLDLSPIAGMTALSLASQTFRAVAFYGRISAGVVFAMILSAVWSASSFVLGFFLIILGLRLIAHLANRSVYHPFWRVVDTIASPLLYRTSRFLFRGRIVRFQTGILAALAALGGLWLAGNALVPLASAYLSRLPF